MAGIYIHIPFCKQKCSYCNYHFSTNLNAKSEIIDAICKELSMRKSEIIENIETIYFGGGTPSLLENNELEQIFDTIYKNFSIAENPEITLEANPDDLSFNKIQQLKTQPINRFSIGVQSFYEEDLKLMNRAHDSNEALNAIKLTQDAGFKNITIDLIYGSQTTSDEIWEKNLQTAINLEVPHISSYVLTIEPKTLLQHQIEVGKIKDIDEEKQARQFQMLIDALTSNDYEHYEISNFGKPNFHSRHNSNYWNGKSYLGIGPSAHSYNGKERSWNIENNAIYIKNIKQGILPNEIETLSLEDEFNELIMIKLRTSEGLNLTYLKNKFPEEFINDFMEELQIHLLNNNVTIRDEQLQLTSGGKFLADGIAGSLFRI